MKATTDVSLGRAIRALRVARGLSLSQLALAAALDKGYLSRVERGLKVPSVAIVLRISTALEVSAAQLFGAAENHQLIFVTRAGDRDALTADDGNYHMEVLTQGADSFRAGGLPHVSAGGVRQRARSDPPRRRSTVCGPGPGGGGFLPIRSWC
ncbi:helix-turn-helix domain-containing protein [Ancylobacter dichloromethanicus]